MKIMFESQRIEAEWERTGSPYCDHPHFRPEQYLGPGGHKDKDRVCSTCGAVRYPGDEEPPEPRGVKR